MVSNGFCFICGVECVRSKPVGCVGARRTMTAALKRTSEGVLFCKGLRSLARTRKLVMLLARRKATIGVDLNMLWQRWDEVKILMCLRMMEEMERRAGLHVSMNGTHSDLSVVMVVALFGKSASIQVMIFARLISCRRKCRYIMSSLVLLKCLAS